MNEWMIGLAIVVIVALLLVRDDTRGAIIAGVLGVALFVWVRTRKPETTTSPQVNSDQPLQPNPITPDNSQLRDIDKRVEDATFPFDDGNGVDDVQLANDVVWADEHRDL